MNLLTKALEDNAIPIRTRIEAIAMVALHVRPMALVFLPAELPQGDVIGRQIDAKYQQWITEGTKGTLLERFYFWLQSAGKTPVEHKKYLLRKAYDEIVESQPSYQALMSHVEALQIPYLLYEVRPSIRELYLCTSPEVKDKLLLLMEERDLIRKEAWAKATPNTPYSLLAYPEEQVPDYLRKLGELLGYPECCIEAYLSDRAQGINVENRSSYALIESGGDDSSLSFILKDFFPCSPTCEHALGKGKECYEQLRTLGEEYGQEYVRLTTENKKRVSDYPAIISTHLNKLESTTNKVTPL